MATQARSLHIGVNEVDSTHYGNSFSGNLKGCENDAKFMYEIAKFHKYQKSKTLLGRDATSEAILSEIAEAAAQLPEGSFFLLTFAGHGGQLPNNDPSDKERFDQTWCAFDRQIVDDELYCRWPLFKKNVRVLVVSDSCSSGTILTRFRTLEERELPPYLVRALPDDVAIETYNQNKDEYEAIRSGVVRPKTEDIAASILSISACEDAEFAADDDPHGKFTEALAYEWEDGRFVGSHMYLWSLVSTDLSSSNQHPDWDYAGTLDLAFWQADAFKP